MAKLALGTVQFGLDYGISNARGKVPEVEVASLFAYALGHGVDMLDTAQAYGESELVLGKHADSSFHIVTKISGIGRESVHQAFTDSLERLNRDRVYGCLLHDFQAYLSNPDVWQELVFRRDQGQVDRIGFSLYHPEELAYLLENNIDFSLVQIPYSLFDQRFASYFPILKERGVEIHVRSVFLQGLFFCDPATLSSYFTDVKQRLADLQTLSSSKGIALSQLCLGFALANPFIDRVVIGVTQLSELKENLAAFDSLDRILELAPSLSSFSLGNHDILIPSNWPKERIS